MEVELYENIIIEDNNDHQGLISSLLFPTFKPSSKENIQYQEELQMKDDRNLFITFDSHFRDDHFRNEISIDYNLKIIDFSLQSFDFNQVNPPQKKKAKKLKKLIKINSNIGKNETGFNNGRWKEDEHKRFIEAIIKYGNEWKSVQKYVKTRSSTQARSHAQKFFSKMQKKNFLENKIDFNKNSIQSLQEFTHKLNENQYKNIFKALNSISFERKKEKTSKFISNRNDNIRRRKGKDTASVKTSSSSKNKSDKIYSNNESEVYSLDNILIETLYEQDIFNLKAKNAESKSDEDSQSSNENEKSDDDSDYYTVNYEISNYKQEPNNKIKDYQDIYIPTHRNSFATGWNDCFNNTNKFKFSDDEGEYFMLYTAESSKKEIINENKLSNNNSATAPSSDENFNQVVERPKKKNLPFTFMTYKDDSLVKKNFMKNQVKNIKNQPRKLFHINTGQSVRKQSDFEKSKIKTVPTRNVKFKPFKSYKENNLKHPIAK